MKLCPTCRVRRGTTRTSPRVSDKGSPSNYMDTQSPPEMLSPPDSRRSSVVGRQCNLSVPVQQVTYSSAFQLQNRWMSSAPQAQRYASPGNGLVPAPSHTLGSNVESPFHYSSGNFQSMDGNHTAMGTTYLGYQANARHQSY